MNIREFTQLENGDKITIRGQEYTIRDAQKSYQYEMPKVDDRPVDFTYEIHLSPGGQSIQWAEVAMSLISPINPELEEIETAETGEIFWDAHVIIFWGEKRLHAAFPINPYDNNLYSSLNSAVESWLYLEGIHPSRTSWRLNKVEYIPNEITLENMEIAREKRTIALERIEENLKSSARKIERIQIINFAAVKNSTEKLERIVKELDQVWDMLDEVEYS